MYKWFLAWRYLHTKLIAFFGIASVTLCVAMVLVVLSVMGGFLDTVRNRSRGLHSEIVMDAGSMQGFPYYDEFADYVQKKMPDAIRTTTPSVTTYGLYRDPAFQRTGPTQVMGIKLDEYVKVNSFGDGLHYQKYFPGTTYLGPQQMPVAGIGVDDTITLPPDLVEANKRWRESETDKSLIERFDKMPFQTTPFPSPVRVVEGERQFARRFGPPGYEGPMRSGIIMGCDLVNRRRNDGNFDRMLARGADIVLTLMPLSPAGNPTGEPPAKLHLRYVDDSRTGIYDIDNMSVYVDFDLLQSVLGMDAQQRVGGSFSKPRANQLYIALKDGVDMNVARDEITLAWIDFLTEEIPAELSTSEAIALGNVRVFTWEDLQRDFIQAVEKEKILVTILFSLISLVAVVLVGCIFYMIVEKKTKDIGILKAVGASGRGIAGLFIAYAAAVGVFGSILGLAVGTAFVWNINSIQDWLAWLNPSLRVWSPDVYTFDKIPEIVKQADAIWIGIVAIISSMIGSLIPAYAAAKVWPVKALRYE